MITNPSTLGIFEQRIPEIAENSATPRRAALYDGGEHERSCGRDAPRDLGVDVMHLNLHKTFSTHTAAEGPERVRWR